MEDAIVTQLRAYGISVQDNFSEATTFIATEGYELVLLLGVLRGLQRKMNYRRAPISHCHQSMNGIPRTFAFQKHRVLWRRKFQGQSVVFGLKEMTIVSTKATMESQQKQRWNRYKRIPSNEHRRPVAKNNRECQSQSHQKSQKLEAMSKNNSECRSQIHKNSRRR